MFVERIELSERERLAAGMRHSRGNPFCCLERRGTSCSPRRLKPKLQMGTENKEGNSRRTLDTTRRLPPLVLPNGTSGEKLGWAIARRELANQGGPKTLDLSVSISYVAGIIQHQIGKVAT